MSALEELFGLRGRVAWVTGASSGLGAECARALAKAGARLAISARREEKLRDVAAELEALGAEVCIAPADVVERGAIEGALDRAESELGPVDVLVNSAGSVKLGRAERHTRDKWDETIELNLTSAFEQSQAVATRLIARGAPGRIIHVSSVMGRGANPVHRAVSYSASKGGLDNLTRHLAMEWAGHGITVNAVAPSYFPSEMTIDPSHGDIAPDQKERMATFTPLGRVGRAGELETAIVFLAAPASTYVTGVVLPVDGGWTAW